MSKTWTELVNQQRELRAQHIRQCTLAGGGQPVDDEMWPIIDRLWSLGIMTTGSCQGHPQADGSWSPSYVVVRGCRDGTVHRWHEVVLGLLDVPAVAGIEHRITKLGWACHYSDCLGELTLETKWRHGLNDFMEVLDRVGTRILQRQGLTWEPWAGPALEVPPTIQVIPDFTTKYLAFRQRLSAEELMIFDLGLEFSSLAEVAPLIKRSIEQVRDTWHRLWNQFAPSAQNRESPER
ncbi:MAG: hypothetical protein C7B47_17240 [Sulfobacillus thermosulfidooxidans]|uniref:Uncharacterized protein n=1 Tax=Sulfobacillus thermosulfidooxidans TaxID=28034 RepID=A0A2T2WH41_SULTH|nr:MAG: hypothetical protein C7B47_17240 [Sulfobacillus thermosulfidooxidans]